MPEPSEDSRQPGECQPCHGAGCPRCLDSGRTLYAIGDLVVWHNQDDSLAPLSVRAQYKERYVGEASYTVVGLQPYPVDLPVPGPQKTYYVGIELPPTDDRGALTMMLFPHNLRFPRGCPDEANECLTQGSVS